MNIKDTLVLLLVLISAISLNAHDKKKRENGSRAVRRETHSLAGLGASWGSAGITHVERKTVPAVPAANRRNGL